MAGWVETGWVQAGWVESATVAEVTPLVLPDPGFVHGGTSFGDPLAIQLIYHRNPGPYSDEAIFVVKTWAGHRVYGRKMPPEVIPIDDIGRFATLLSSSGISVNTVPMGNELVGSIGTTERPRATVTLDNRRKEWSRLVVVEPLLAVAAGTWLHYGAGDTHVLLQGQVERVVIRQSQTMIEWSEP